MKLRMNVNVLGRDTRFFFGIDKNYTSWKVGVTNRCVDGTFVLFLDYDDTPFQWVIDELQYLQQKERLGDLHIFRTAKGYHVVNTEKRSFAELLRLMQQTSCDPNYINVPLKYGKKAWTLRVSNKKGKRRIRYVTTLLGKNRLVQSSIHNQLLRTLYGVKIRRHKEDGEKSFYKSAYPLRE